MLQKKIEEMKKRRGKSYKPRTRHLDANGWAKYTNRLFLESSPYLLQHAHNPVNWYPWGEEAFEEAKRLDRPVFVSIGYSTCHWCHVMEEESFEDEAIAEYLNTHFISIKVDREERPDIDAVYMSAVQALSGVGGWPLNAWLTPHGKPFYGATYFPPRDGDRGASMGFFTVLKKINEGYQKQRVLITESSEKLTEFIQKLLVPKSGSDIPDITLIQRVVKQYQESVDPVYGGAQGTPKFPSTLPIRLLLHQYVRSGDEKLLDLSSFTLKKMADGGIYDQVGGGFHRYSTDEKWLVPHFEKMLYDNAILAMVYLEAWQASGKARFKKISQEILDYVKREMRSPEGAFYSATDADSQTPEGRRGEGYFFTWTPGELEETLGKERARLVKQYFSVGNSPDFEGRHILHLTEESRAVAASLKMTDEEFSTALGEAKEKLYEKRALRPSPFLDRKIITSWNGLMISAFARAGLLLDNDSYTQTAKEAANFVLTKLFKNKRLLRSYNDQQARYNAYLDDYAFFSAALLDLYEATFDLFWLEKAVELDAILGKHYEDKADGGFFMTSDDHENLIAREKTGFDGALPSGNSIAAMNLLRLYTFTTQESYLKRVEKLFTAFPVGSSGNAAGYSEMLIALNYYLNKPKEVIIVTPEGELQEAKPFLDALRKVYLPNRMLAVVSEGEMLQAHQQLIPTLSGKKALDGKAAAYVCEQGLCKLAAKTPEEFVSLLQASGGLLF